MFRSPAARACYWSTWGVGQPCADLRSPEWRAELKKIFAFWVGRGLPKFVLGVVGVDVGDGPKHEQQGIEQAEPEDRENEPAESANQEREQAAHRAAVSAPP